MTSSPTVPPAPNDRAPRSRLAWAVLGILVGYAIFAVTGIALFRVSRQDPSIAASPGFLAISVVWGVFWAMVAGYVASVIAARRDLVAGVGVAIIMALGAVMSIVMQPEAPHYWSQIAAIVAMAPAAVFGAALHSRRGR